VHTHPALANGLLCAKKSREKVKELFGEEIVYIPYTDPGYLLFKKVEIALHKFRGQKGFEPAIIFLENHGVFVGAESTDKIDEIYLRIEHILKVNSKAFPEKTKEKDRSVIDQLAGKIESCFEPERFICRVFQDALTDLYVKGKENFQKISKPFTPDNIVYCKSNYLYVEHLSDIIQNIRSFKSKYGYYPKIIVVQNLGIISLDVTDKSAQVTLDVYLNMLKIAYLSENYGGPRPLTPTQIDFIDSWEVENYRRRVSKSN
jgi:rhamnose utilization protein RhaD (predicted bifunctional aldolase and dehydrogenase)